jgi:hypothetical protein
VGVPVKAGLAKGAYVEATSEASDVIADSRAVVSVETALSAYAVVAICVLFVPAEAVGAVGVPVKAGLAKGAYVSAIKVCKSVIAASRADTSVARLALFIVIPYSILEIKLVINEFKVD